MFWHHKTPGYFKDNIIRLSISGFCISIIIFHVFFAHHYSFNVLSVQSVYLLIPSVPLSHTWKEKDVERERSVKKQGKLTYGSTFTAQQKFQLDRVHLQEVKRSSYEHTKKCADQLLLLGQVSITLHTQRCL